MTQETTTRASAGKSWTNTSGTRTRVIAVTSGKGGVGKSNLVVNLALALAAFRKRVVILDADMGLANVDVLLGIKPRFNLRHVVFGQKELADVIIDGPGGIRIIPASSGLPELADLPDEERERFLEKLAALEGEADILLIDTPAGIASNVMGFVRATKEVIVVTTPEPTAITDAYAMIKVATLHDGNHHIRVLVNMTSDTKEAGNLFEGVSLIANRFLGRSIDYLGCIEWDPNVRDAVKRQEPFFALYPHSPASRAIRAVGAKLCNYRTAAGGVKGVGEFFQQVAGFFGKQSSPRSREEEET